MYTYTKKMDKELLVNLKPQIPHDTHLHSHKKAVSEAQTHANGNTHAQL